jgi:hypothetical protein
VKSERGEIGEKIIFFLKKKNRKGVTVKFQYGKMNEDVIYSYYKP